MGGGQHGVGSRVASLAQKNRLQVSRVEKSSQVNCAMTSDTTSEAGLHGGYNIRRKS